jgi:hypothetical protein
MARWLRQAEGNFAEPDLGGDRRKNAEGAGEAQG